MKLSDELFNLCLKTISSYPEEIKPVKQRLKGSAFFPGGDGIYKEGNWNILEKYPILFVGQDYDNEFNFKTVLKLKTESEIDNKNKTWLNLIKLFGEDTLGKSFFTNAIMGLRKDESKNTGKSVAFKKTNIEFLKKNCEFFKQQLNILQPEIMICLGIQVPRFIGHCFPDQATYLMKISNYKELDQCNENGIHYIKHEQREIKVIFLTHPSFYDANVSRRKEGKGKEFEKNLIDMIKNHIK